MLILTRSVAVWPVVATMMMVVVVVMVVVVDMMRRRGRRSSRWKRRRGGTTRGVSVRVSKRDFEDTPASAIGGWFLLRRHGHRKPIHATDKR